MSFEGKSQQEPRNWQMDRILIILKKGKPPKGFICPCTGVKYHNIQTCLLVYAADSGERLQDHWSSGFVLRFINYILSKEKIKVGFFMSPPDRVGRHIVFPRASVCLSVRHKSCPLYNLKTVKDFSMKLGTLVNHDETMCHAQEP